MSKSIVDMAVICCYNNAQQLEEYLLLGLDFQSVDCERVLIDNANKAFSSAAAALNYGAQKSISKYLIFVHQDIRFTDKDALRKIYEKMEQCDDANTIWGAAGVALEFGNKVISWMQSPGIKRNPNMNKDMIEVEALDECMIIMSRDMYKRYLFNERVCDNWHFYVVEMCIRARLESKRVAVIDMYCFHGSAGSRNRQFYEALRKLYKEYRGKIPYIKTCCIYADLRVPVLRYELSEMYRNRRNKH